MTRPSILAICAMAIIISTPLRADDLPQARESLEIRSPYVDLHSGPGESFPVYRSVERGHPLFVEKRRNDWYLVRSTGNISGWISRKALLAANGQPTNKDASVNAYSRQWGAAINLGGGSGSHSVTLNGDWFFTPAVAAEASVGNIFAGDREYDTALIGAQYHFPGLIPSWHGLNITPFAGVGVGYGSSRGTTPTDTTTASGTVRLLQGGAEIPFRDGRIWLRIGFDRYSFNDSEGSQEATQWKLGTGTFF